jgi:ABC-type sugar transport system permease subunit
MQFVKSILKWVFLIVFVAPQAIGMAIFVGIPLFVGCAIAFLADDVLDTWRVGKRQRELEEMERWNRERGGS